MAETNQPTRIISIVLVGVGIVLLGITIFSGGSLNAALPLVFLVLGCVFIVLGIRLRQEWKWAALLNIPGLLLIAFGIIFLLNVLTNDWNSWAYAWLLLVAAIGIGLILAGRGQTWPQAVILVGWSMALAGITLFAVFGAIAGGLLIQVIAPIILVAAGVSVRWLHLETLVPASILSKLHINRQIDNKVDPTNRVEALVEPLSSRELEVLRLIDTGLSNQQIADRLSVAASTVKTHINNIYSKLGVQTRVQAINRARELGLFNH